MDTSGQKRHLHLSHPRLDFWVTAEIWEREGRYMATADLAEDSRDVGVGDTPQDAVRAALESLGEPLPCGAQSSDDPKLFCVNEVGHAGRHEYWRIARMN